MGHGWNRLGRKKVFIVLDDVDTSEQLENLIEDFDFLGLGSRVIVTTRNKQIFSQVDKIYKVKELSIHHSLKLFCLSVFREKQPKHGYEDLSRSAISYCKGIPLALKVLGASLRSRSKQAWECELRKLQKFPNMEIHNVLKLSYDGLDYSQKEIFLDIACFLRGKQRDHVTSILEAFDFPAASGIEVLLDKALITISGGIQIEMHDLIQEMGWKIVHQEHIKDPGRRSRLWKHEEVHDVLKYNKNLVNLKTIDLWGSRDLVEIPDLSKAEKLESVSLCYCESLCQLQVHSKSLGVLNLYGCSSLREFLVTSEELTELNLAFTAICALPSSIWQKRKLRSLYLRGCHNLNKLSDEPRFCGSYKHSITTLASNVKRLPVNIENLSMMTMIWLDDCRKLVSLPELPLFLEKLSACNCTSLDTKITQQQVLQHMLQSRIPYLRKHYLKCYDEEYFFPGDHVIDECRFHTTQNSITIPYLQKPELCGFIYCIILSMGPLLECDVSCSVYQDGIRVGWLERLLEYENLISDHVVILYHDISEFDKISEVHDHFFSNITFIFENNEDRITEFGVFPVYASESGLKLVGSKEIFE
ncbi:TMV resistance protein N isoform H [Glycine soja]|uniref:TMV resistance protein N isoform H n=1 Tax=Glycine soja TaxID=3848 RepID=A0A445HCL5_GLYSO|nr:TMV resistance protein N isoform H [Glycine soja]